MIKTIVAQIVSSYVGSNPTQAEAVPGLIQSVYQALNQAPVESSEPKPLDPAVPVRKSVFPDYIVCLEDGKRLKMLKRHLKTRYNMTPEQYRQKWGLSRDYPMVAPNYANKRSALAKTIGLGRKRVVEDQVEQDLSKKQAEPEFAQEPADSHPVIKVPEGRRGLRRRAARPE